jgi:hypothetical protein
VAVDPPFAGSGSPRRGAVSVGRERGARAGRKALDKGGARRVESAQGLRAEKKPHRGRVVSFNRILSEVPVRGGGESSSRGHFG